MADMIDENHRRIRQKVAMAIDESSKNTLLKEGFALLQKQTSLSSPAQQTDLCAFAASKIGVETTVYHILMEARQRHSSQAAQRSAAANERTRNTREQAETSANATAAGPMFVAYSAAGIAIDLPS